MATNTKKVLLPHTLGQEARALLDARSDVTPIYFPHLMPNDEFLELVKAEAPVTSWILGPTRISVPHIEAAEALAVTARLGVGYDAIDVPAHTERGVPVMTAGLGNAPSVAEHALFMMLSLAKNAAGLDRMVREGRWLQRNEMMPTDLLEKRVLVVGFGRIGTRIAKRCDAMEMTVDVYDPYVDDAVITAAGYTPVSDLDAAVAAADFVTIHCPKTDETRGMFDATRIGRMKPTACLVNTARGGLIDEDALHGALTAGKLRGA
ncbi:MAG: NAD(P)-dependent oxidoreductase, partial [Pseudomonadota bacterium]